MWGSLSVRRRTDDAVDKHVHTAQRKGMGWEAKKKKKMNDSRRSGAISRTRVSLAFVGWGGYIGNSKLHLIADRCISRPPDFYFFVKANDC